MAATVMVGLSGGVDSAVAAWQLLESGFDAEALFMKNWDEDDTPEYCAAAADLEDAQAICATLGIRLHTANFSAEYWTRVFESFLAEYAAGRTPNPDVWCNRDIKFRAFLDHARRLGATAIATGHYAGLRRGATVQLVQARDAAKDQTYFLHLLNQEQLQASSFPLQRTLKQETRRIARRLGLSVHDKKDSTGICFIGERRFQDFLARYIPTEPGPIADADGRVLGEHSGLPFYTLGQRTGLGIGGVADAEEKPWYVLDKQPEARRLIVTQDRRHPVLNVRELEIEPPHWIAGTPPDPKALQARIRPRQPLQACTIESGEAAMRVRFDAPQWAPAPGQSAVFYDGPVCLGGGIITRTFPHP